MADSQNDSDRMPLSASHEDIMASLIRSSHKTAEWRRAMDRRFDKLEHTVETALKELRTNTQETIKARETIQTVSDGLIMAKTFRRFVVWIAPITAAIAAVWAFWNPPKG